MSGTASSVTYVGTVKGKEATLTLSYENGVAGRGESAVESSTPQLNPSTWATTGAFAKAVFNIDAPHEDLDCVSLRDSVDYGDELASHEEYDQRVRRLAGHTVSKSMSRLESIRSSLLSSSDGGEESPDSEDLTVHIASWNCGNAAPPVPEKMDPWIPNGGRGADIIAVCVQECTYDEDKKIQEEILGKLQVTVKSASGFAGEEVNSENLDRYVQLSVEPDASVKKPKKQEGRTAVAKASPNPAWDETVQVAVKDGLSSEGFSVFPTTKRLVVKLMAEVAGLIGSSQVMLAEGEHELVVHNGEITEEGAELELELAGPRDMGGTVVLGLHYDMHLEADALQKQVDFSLQAAAETQELAAAGEVAHSGSLRVTVVSGSALSTDSTAMASSTNLLGDAVDPQVRLRVGSHEQQTKVLQGAVEPEWNEDFEFHLTDAGCTELNLEIVNVEDDTEQFFGSISVPIESFLECSEPTERALELDTGSNLVIRVQFVEAAPATELSHESSEATGVHFFEVCKQAAGSGYYVVGHHVMWQIQMVVLARREIRQHITKVEHVEKKTGLAGGLIANKGGVVFRLAYKGHELAFINTHLAAHEGIEFRHDRNRMASEVQAAGRVGNTAIDLGNQFHHTFWAGDLNYRVEFKDWIDPSDGTLTKAVKKEDKMLQVKRLIDQEKWPVLWAADELRKELAAGRVFAGFRDSVCDFPPTFKVEKGYVLKYNPKRAPSYCDRILYRSSAGYEGCMHQEAFNAAPNLITSDHKPVWARFKLSIPPSLATRQHQVAQPSKVVMRLSNVELVGLNAELGITRLTLHDEHLFGHGTHSMTNLTGSEAPHLVQTKVSAAEILRGEVRDPSGGEGTAAFSHSVTLQVAEKGQLETVDLGYATLALRDEAEEAVTLGPEETAEWDGERKFRGRLLYGEHFPLFRRLVSLPVSLNGVDGGGVLRFGMEIAESYTPLYTLLAGTTLRLGIELGAAAVIELAAGDPLNVSPTAASPQTLLR